MKISQLDQHPERKDTLAQLFADGAKHASIAETFGVNVDTIGDWKKRGDIQARVSKIIEQRANTILALTDTSILKRLEHARDNDKPIPVETLLQIRRTMAGERLTVDTAGDSAKALQEMMQRLHADPALAAAFSGAMSDDPDAD